MQTQEVPYTEEAPGSQIPGQSEKASVTHWCVFTRVGTRKSRGESAQR